MDRELVLAAFNSQIRQRMEPEGPGMVVERADGVVRMVSTGAGWSGVLWTELSSTTAHASIAATIARLSPPARSIARQPAESPAAPPAESWEWKYYSYDQPEDLPQRLLAAGFVPEPAETLLVAAVADLELDVPPPAGVSLHPVVDAQGIDLLVAVHDEVFGDDNSRLGRALAEQLGREPATVAAVVAMADGQPISSGRLELTLGTNFASLWGGGTVAAWRRRGVFRALVAYRAALAREAGFRYLQVDASDDSLPILKRLGFVELAKTTPFVWSG